VLCLASFPKLLIAAVNGLASGLGLSILPLCDLVYASDNATFNSLAARYRTITKEVFKKIRFFVGT
jgi:enoyl-CoA hydratase/carnithine racemase